MANDDFPSSWRDPSYVATVVGVLATGSLFFYSALVETAPSAEEIGLVILWVMGPSWLAYEVARRWL